MDIENWVMTPGICFPYELTANVMPDTLAENPDEITRINTICSKMLIPFLSEFNPDFIFLKNF